MHNMQMKGRLPCMDYVCKKSQLSCTNYVCKKSQLSCMNYACRKCQMSCGYQVAKILPYNPPIITHEISNFILYDMCMRDDYHAHISHLSGIMKRHFFPSVMETVRVSFVTILSCIIVKFKQFKCFTRLNI